MLGEPRISLPLHPVPSENIRNHLGGRVIYVELVLFRKFV
jgi:hypothetical protein